MRTFACMIQLYPNKKYSIHYGDGRSYTLGTILHFETLDTIPLAKHLIQVRDSATGEIVDLMDFLSHPWLDIEEEEIEV